MILIVADTETAGDEKAIACMDPIVGDKRLKDPEKVKADLEAKVIERELEASLHPDTCRLVALSYYVVGQNGDPFCSVMKDEFEEREHLKAFAALYNTLNKRNEVRLVTFYGMNFDLPVLMSRAMYLDVDFPDLNIDRYSRESHAHYDVWWRLSRKGAVKAKGLKFYLKRFGIDTHDGIEGSQIGQLVKDERWDDIASHCVADVGGTHALAARLGMLKV